MSGFISPMLADKIPTDASLDSEARWAEWSAEEKYDGHRLGIRVLDDSTFIAWSRLGNVRHLPPLIDTAVRTMPEGYYDGELYVPGKHSTDVAAGINQDEQRLVLFDMVEALGASLMDMTLTQRRAYLAVSSEIAEQSGVVHRSATLAPTQDVYKTIVARGGEGVMLKHNESKYRPGARVQTWLKVKRMVETELPIAGFREGTQKGVLSIVELRLPNGKDTTVKARTVHDALAFTKSPDAFIGRMMEVEAQEWTRDGLLRHPRMVRLAGPHE